MNKKILIITYYWPPAGGIGVQRWLKFSHLMAEQGLEVYIYTALNPSYPILDTSLSKEVHPKIKLIKRKILEPYAIAEKLSSKNKDFKRGQFDTQNNTSWLSNISVFMRGNFFIPDARFLWIKPSVRFLKKFIKEHAIETIISTGPPHSMHLIAKNLKAQNHNIQWLADFRDPWTAISYHKHLKLTKWAQKKHESLEKQVMKTADSIIATSYSDAENFKRLGAKKVSTLTNGFDFFLKKQNEKNSKFTLSYVGLLEQLRNPEVIWQAISELIEEQAEFKQNVRLQFIGKIDSQILNKLSTMPLNSIILNIGFVTYKEAQEYMRKSDLLLLSNFNSEESKGIIPGKLYEYFAAQKPILALGPNNSDVSKILIETKAGKQFGYTEKKKIKTYIFSIFSQWKDDKSFAEPKNLDRFLRENIVKDLLTLI